LEFRKRKINGIPLLVYGKEGGRKLEIGGEKSGTDSPPSVYIIFFISFNIARKKQLQKQQNSISNLESQFHQL